MTVVSSNDFAINQEKYFDLAIDEQVVVRRGNCVFHIIHKSLDDTDMYHDASVYERVLEPDDDFRRAFSAEEFREKLIVVLERVDKKYADKCK